MSTDFQLVIDEIKTLSITQLNQTKSLIDGFIKDKSKEFLTDGYKRPNCPYCGSSIIKKNGKTSNNSQKYLCLNDKCHKSFSSRTNTFLYRSKKFNDYLYLMTEYTLEGLSIRDIASKLSLPIVTIWQWRTKILTHINEFIDNENPLSTLFYSDETYIKINLKGTKPHNMPRPSYMSKIPVKAHRELVCIQSVIDNTKRPIFKINGVARLTSEKLDAFIKPLMTSGATLVSDGENSYVGFSWDNDIIHERVDESTGKSENGFSLGPINNLHSSFKFYLSKYRGVSTRRLQGYIDLFTFNFLLNQILTFTEKIEYLYESLLDSTLHISVNDINSCKFPIGVENIFKELIKEGIIEFPQQHLS